MNMDRRLMDMLHHLADSDNYLDRFREFLSGRNDPNMQNELGNTLLHTAAQSFRKNIEITRELINAGANVNLVNRTGYTPLLYAAIRRKREMIEALLQAGADINAGTPSGITALHYAINNSGYELLQRVSSIPDMETIRILLQHENIDINARGTDEETPLMWAVTDKQLPVVHALLMRGANPNICNSNKDSPLHKALDLTDPIIFITYLLLRFGANLCSLDGDNRTPIDILIDRINDNESLRFAQLVVKIIAFHYNVSEKVRRNLEKHPDLSRFQLVCCAEVNLMRTQIISRNLTVHDFMLQCFNEDQFQDEFQDDIQDLCLPIYKPLVDILMTGAYSTFLREILLSIEKYQLWKVLRYNLLVKNELENFCNVGNLIFLRLFLNCVLSDYMSHWELFQVILATTNLTTNQIRAINNLET